MSRRSQPVLPVLDAQTRAALGCLAGRIGMPRLCAIRACRRHRACIGPGAICLWHHQRFAEERVARLKRRQDGTAPPR